jgi:hypothetical protein
LYYGVSEMQQEAETAASRPGIGGDFAWECSELWEERAVAPLFATGRDALAAIVGSRGSRGGVWLVPEFICPVVPDTLRACGAAVRPYRWLTPWKVDAEHAQKLLPQAEGIVVPFYMGLPPAAEVWELLRTRPACVVEDRCQCVGRPPAADDVRGDYAVGSFRKWMPVTDGAYCVARKGVLAVTPSEGPNRQMVRLRLAAALAKQARLSGLPQHGIDGILESAAVELFRLGEILAGTPGGPRRATQLAEERIRTADFDAIAAARTRNQAWLAARLAEKREVNILEPESGALANSTVPALALPVICDDRERIRSRLAERRIYCAVHWIDGDWSGQRGATAELASRVLSLPIDQRYGPEQLSRIVEAMR